MLSIVKIKANLLFKILAITAMLRKKFFEYTDNCSISLFLKIKIFTYATRFFKFSSVSMYFICSLNVVFRESINLFFSSISSLIRRSRARTIDSHLNENSKSVRLQSLPEEKRCKLGDCTGWQKKFPLKFLSNFRRKFLSNLHYIPRSPMTFFFIF